MTEDDDQSLEDLTDYREDPRWRMENIRNLATKDRDDTDIIVQHPVREEAPEDADVEFIETMGLSVGSPSPQGVFSIHNTSSDTSVTERFVALDVSMVDDLIDALEEAKSRYAGDRTFDCPCCAETFIYPDELDEDEYGYICPECEYLL